MKAIAPKIECSNRSMGNDGAIVGSQTNFADELRKIYIAKNWTIPSDNPEAHHIKPLAWGGGNDPSTNGVFLGRTTHTLFTTWWANFSNLNW